MAKKTLISIKMVSNVYVSEGTRLFLSRSFHGTEKDVRSLVFFCIPMFFSFWLGHQGNIEDTIQGLFWINHTNKCSNIIFFFSFCSTEGKVLFLTYLLPSSPIQIPVFLFILFFPLAVNCRGVTVTSFRQRRQNMSEITPPKSFFFIFIKSFP